MTCRGALCWIWYRHFLYYLSALLVAPHYVLSGVPLHSRFSKNAHWWCGFQTGCCLKMLMNMLP